MKQFLSCCNPGELHLGISSWNTESGVTHTVNSPVQENEKMESGNDAPTTFHIVPEKTTFYKMLQSSSEEVPKSANAEQHQVKDILTGRGCK